MQKNTSHEGEVNQLTELLNENIKKNGAKLHKARITLIFMVIMALCKVQTVSFHKLALAFDAKGKAGSSPRRLLSATS